MMIRKTYETYKKSFLTSLFLLGFVAFTSGVANAALVVGVAVEEFSSEQPCCGPRLADHTIDGSGFTAGLGIAGTHTNASSGMWQTIGDPHIAAAGDTRFAHIVYDLGAVYDISDFHLWNYNETPEQQTRGAKGLTLFTSATSTLTGLAAPAGGSAIADLGIATGANGYVGQAYATSFTARYVRFDIESTHATDGAVAAGLSEVRFNGVLAPPVVPEPNTIVLSLVGLMGFAVRRRRRNRG